MKARGEDIRPGIAKVVVPGVRKIFHYTIPSSLRKSALPGIRVRISLGRRKTIGYLVSRIPESSVPKLKDISDVLDEAPLLTEEMLRLTRWISDYYLAPWGTVIRCVLPAGIDTVREKRERVYRMNLPAGEIRKQLPRLERKTPAQVRVLKAFLASPGEYTSAFLRTRTGTGPDVLRRLVKNGFLCREERTVLRDPFAGEKPQQSSPPRLTKEQEKAVRQINGSLKEGLFQPFLLHGVTGSGKTEVYLRAIETTLARGKEAIVIVPEIALTPQLVRIFRSRFADKVSVLHSGLSEGERVDQWRRIRRGEAGVAIGARSAVFAPFSHLGIIVVDEEHDTTYKQGETPRYHARDLAVVRGKQNHATVILGSATPSVESFHHARSGKYRLLTLNQRIDARPLPEIRLIDMKEVKNGDPLSPQLIEALREGLQKKEQVLLFLNRRGFSPFLLCSTCGYVHRCPNCSVSLTYHRGAGHLTCHYCDYTTPLIQSCPECKTETLELKGCGTERIEEVVEKTFHDSVLLRLDRDTTRRKGAAQKILDRFRSREGDILIGTQMVTKGHHLPGITTVGVLNADASLHHPDFRAGERTFQTLIQVAGRAGRGKTKGKVYLQSYTPEHYSIQAAVEHDYTRFYDEEISFREALNYPPYSRLVNLVLSANSGKKVEHAATQLGKILRSLALHHRGMEILGPAQAPLSTLRGKKRFQLLIKGKSVRSLNRLVGEGIKRFTGLKGTSGIDLTVDVDPVNFQ
ncbi:MAG: primosomal protein N' [Deltaproteobacteria bacterium]|nr:primosomal protein N' [Deltaproteobacteria bacterium]